MTDTELPEYIERDVLRDIATVEVPDEAILRCFVQTNKPFLSKSAVSEMTNLSDEGARKRLNSLVERGVLLSDNAGKQTKIYWLNNPRSRWPVPDDLENEFLGDDGTLAKTVVTINRVTTFSLFYASIFVMLYVFDWLSSLPATDGIFEVSMNWTVMPAVAFGLLFVVFYIALQTSIQVENDDAGWPTIRRVYRRMVQ